MSEETSINQELHLGPLSGGCWVSYDKKQPSEKGKPYEVIIESIIDGTPTRTKDTIIFDENGNWVFSKKDYQQKVIAWRRPTVTK